MRLPKTDMAHSDPRYTARRMVYPLWAGKSGYHFGAYLGQNQYYCFTVASTVRH
jgi:hypothetical protein